MKQEEKSSLRQKADKIKDFRCKNLIVVLEKPNMVKNIGTVIRNINALGIEKLYVIDSYKRLPCDWHQMRENHALVKSSVSGIKWSFVKTFSSTQECIEHLKKNKFVSIVTSPHIKGKKNVVLHEGNFTQKRLAVWFGNESSGVSELVIKNSEACIQIEMFGIIESLNLGTATGIVMYEITKQRREYQKRLKKD